MFKKAFALTYFLYAFNISAQVDIKGIIIDKSNNLPIIGATVIIKNTTKGTTTDFDGNFILYNVADNATLVFVFRLYHSRSCSRWC